MEKENKYFIPTITEEELKERKEIKNKRRVTGVIIGASSIFTLYISARIGLRIDEIIGSPLVNNSFNAIFGALGASGFFLTLLFIVTLKEYSQELKEKNEEIREKINKSFNKKEKIETQRIVKYQSNEGNNYEQFLAIIQIHNDLLKQKFECLKQYKVKKIHDDFDCNLESISTEKLYNQYKNYEKKLLQEK